MRRARTIYNIVIAAFAVGILQVPLLNYLGYEFSAACAFALPIPVGFLTIAQYRKTPSLLYSPYFLGIPGLPVQTILLNVPLLGIPFIAATLNMVLVKNCSYGEGMLFYLLLPVVTFVWSITLALFCASLFRKARLWYAGILALHILYGLYLGYYTPAIYSYNFLYGFFPGFSYDEVLTLTTTLALFRVVTLVCALLFATLAVMISRSEVEGDSVLRKVQAIITPGKQPLRFSFSVALLLILCTVWVFRYDLQFETSVGSIKKILSATKTTEHCIIHYAPESFTQDEVDFLALEHEYRFAQVQEALKFTYKGTIESFIYPDDKSKQRCIGAGSTNIAKPWSKQIHLNKDSWQGVLKHELVHVLMGEFGLPVIKAHYNMALNEGIATAIDDEWGNKTLHEYAAGIQRFGIISHPEHLVSLNGFVAQSSSVSYVLMGSFIQFICEGYGIEKFKRLYGGESVMEVYRKPYEELVAQWQEFLEHKHVPPSMRNHIEYYFRRQSIFAKECARTIAKINQAGYDSLASGNYAEAERNFSASLAVSWNTSAFAGLVRARYYRGEFDTVIALLRPFVVDSSKQSSVAHLLLLYGNSLWAVGDTAEARLVFNAILKLDLSSPYNEAALLRVMVLDDPKLSAPMARFFSSTGTGDSAAIPFLDSLLAVSENYALMFIRAQYEYRHKRYVSTITMLDSLINLICDPPRSLCTFIGRHNFVALEFDSLPLPYVLQLELASYDMIGKSYFMLKDYGKAWFNFVDSPDYHTTADYSHKRNTWLSRCAFAQKQFR